MVLHSKILGEGTPFLILHGFLGMGDNWKTLALRFSKLGYQFNHFPIFHISGLPIGCHFARRQRHVHRTGLLIQRTTAKETANILQSLSKEHMQ